MIHRAFHSLPFFFVLTAVLLAVPVGCGSADKESKKPKTPSSKSGAKPSHKSAANVDAKGEEIAPPESATAIAPHSAASAGGPGTNAAATSADSGPTLIAPTTSQDVSTTTAPAEDLATEQATPRPAIANRPEPKYLAGVPLIPRAALFGNPEKAMARISPDGKQLAFLAPVNGVMNVWVGPADRPDAAKPVTKDTKRGIRSYYWAYTSQHILYPQDVGGDEDFHIYCVHLASDVTKDLTPIDKVAAHIVAVSPRKPDEILVGLNERDRKMHDVFLVNVQTGKRTLVEENKQGFKGYVADEDFRIRLAMMFNSDGSNLVLKPDGAGGWTEFMRIPMVDTLTTTPEGFDKSGEILYYIDSRKRDTGALVQFDLKTDEEKVLASNDRADVDGLLAHPTERTIQAVAFNYTRKEWKVLDPSIKGDLDYLRTVSEGDVEVASRTLDDKLWTVAFLLDNGPVRYYLYDRDAKKATFLFTNRKDLEGVPLVKMHPLVIESRDGLNLVSYLSLPPGTDTDDDARPDEPLPLVLNVHGGPWARDEWGYDAEHQLLANRGYAVLSVNFRGSTGFGKSFTNAGDKEWGGKMHLDLLDAVKWAIDQKIADPKRIAITGGSYGGYATLVGVAMTPEVFACGVDIVGPSNIVTLLRSIPPYWQPQVQMFKDRVGDFLTAEGQKFLAERSPLTYAHQIRCPLLIGQGANDPSVKQTEADQIVHAMQQKKIPVTYVLYPDEGHGFARPENRLSFYAVAEAFFAEHLGGRYEPVGKAFAGSTITVPAGADQVPGLAAALEAKSER